MKNGKKPTVAQRSLMKQRRLNSDNWLVVKDTPQSMLIIHRQSQRTREILKGGSNGL